jgi:hypothetical protein
MNLKNCLELKKSENKISKTLTDYMGSGMKIEESLASKRKKDEKFFCGLLERLVELDQRTLQMLEYGVDLTIYDDFYNQVLESFIYKHYGEVKAQIIIWWLLSSQDKEKGIDLTLKLNEESNEFIVNTPKQLYRVLLKLKL